jgi:hypothetical protein
MQWQWTSKKNNLLDDDAASGELNGRGVPVETG